MFFPLKHFYLVFIVIVSWTAAAYAQSSEANIDSLVNAIPDWTNDDMLDGFQSIRERTIELPETIRLQKVASCYERAKLTKSPLATLCAKLLAGESYNKDNSGRSMQAFIDAWLEFQDRVGTDSLLLGYGNYAMGQAYLNTQFVLKSFEHAEFGRVIFERQKADLMALKSRHLIFIIGYSVSPEVAYNEGIFIVDYFRRTHNLAFLTPYQQTGFFNGMGILARKMEQFDQSIECFDIGIDLANKYHFDPIKSLLIGNRGHSLFKKGDYKNALTAIRHDILSSEQLHLPVSKANALITMSQIKLAQNQVDSVRFFFSMINVPHDAEGFDQIRYLELSHALASREGQYQEAYAISVEVNNKKDSVARYRSNFDFNRQRRETALSIQAIDYNAIVTESARKSFLLNVEIGFIALFIILLVVMTLYLRTRQKYLRNIEEEMRLNKEITNTRFSDMNGRLVQLQQEIDVKSQELTSYTLHLIQKNEALETLRSEIEEIRTLEPEAIKSKLGSLTSSINFHFHLDKDWENFRSYFDSVHQQFFNNLKNRLPDITPAETKLCTLLKLRLNSKQVATIMGISPESVKTGRYRLRKRFQLETDQRLAEFLENL